MSLVNQISLPNTLQNISPNTLDVENIFLSKKNNWHQTAKRYKKGAMIYLQDENTDKIFYLSKGKIKISSYSRKGKEMTKRYVDKGEIFGEMGLIGKVKYDDFAVVVDEAIVYSMTKEEFLQQMQSSFSLMTFMIEKLGKALVQTERRLEDLIFESSRNRIIHFIKDLAENKGTKIGYETLVRDWFTHQEIANFTATSRQTVTTILNELRRKNIIYFTRYKLLIRDLELLN